MTHALYITAASALLNPTLDAEAIASAVSEDTEGAASEWLGTFRSDIAEYLPDGVLDAAIVPGRNRVPARPGVLYAAFCDPSGGTGADSMTLAIGHLEEARLVLDRLVARKPPFDPESVVAEFAVLLTEFGLARCTGDRYGAAWVSSSFARHGIAYESSSLDKSAIFTEVAKLFVENRVELLEDQQMLVEFRMLERRPRSGGRQDLIDHPRGGHDDRANAVAGCLWLVSEREQREAVVAGGVAIAATQRPAPDVRFAPRVLASVIDGDRAYIARRRARLALEPLTYEGDPLLLASKVAAEADRWSALSIYLADCSPGAPVIAALRRLNYTPIQVDLFGSAYTANFADARAELAFRLADWLEQASVPPTMLHDLTAAAFTTRRGVAELLEQPLGIVDALAITLLDRSSYQDPRTVTHRAHITRAMGDDGRYGGHPSGAAAAGRVQPYDLGDREPTLERDGWARCLPAEPSARSLTDYDPLDR